METLTEVCTCDDSCDSPCPRHRRENELQNVLLAMQEENRKLRERLKRVQSIGSKAPASVHPDDWSDYERGWNTAFNAVKKEVRGEHKEARTKRNTKERTGLLGEKRLREIEKRIKKLRLPGKPCFESWDGTQEIESCMEDLPDKGAGKGGCLELDRNGSWEFCRSGKKSEYLENGELRENQWVKDCRSLVTEVRRLKEELIDTKKRYRTWIEDSMPELGGM